MTNLVSAIDGMFSVTDFNKGKANQIFDSIKTNRIGIVVKNNKPECILLSPEEYKRIMRIIEDYEDYSLALQRLSNNDMSQALSSNEVFFDVADDDLKQIGDVEFE